MISFPPAVQHAPAVSQGKIKGVKMILAPSLLLSAPRHPPPLSPRASLVQRTAVISASE